jgi:HD-GYP domain-containing protein (c-di-GMP phosphodiesterase class II)
MMYSLPATPLSNNINSRTWPVLLRAVTIIGREIEPEIYAHFQPHAFATARLARRFASYIEGIRGRLHRYEEVEFGAFMHDIGKYYIAPELLLKPGPLNNEERMIVSLHSVYGAIAISKLPGITNVIRRIILHHHEHWDGSGYPDGLSGINIPLEARIVAIADVYISLRAKRSYKPTLVKEEAFGLLKEMAGRELDSALVEDFLRMFGVDNRIL